MDMGDNMGSKRRRLGDEVPPGGRGGEDVDPDLISRLPDEILGCIITLLPIKDGARTQILSRRWGPLWQSAPLNLEVYVGRGVGGDGGWNLLKDDERVSFLLCKILSAHKAPVRRLSLTYGPLDFGLADSLLQSLRLPNVQEFELRVYSRLPPSALRFLPSLRVLWLYYASEFPMEMANSKLNFGTLKELTIFNVCIPDPESTLHGVLSRCPVLESLVLGGINCPSLHIRSPTLRSLGVSDGRGWAGHILKDLVIVDAPLLERLISRVPSDVLVIRVIQAPRLATLGYLHEVPEFQFGTMLFEKMVPVHLSDAIRSVKILGLFTAPNLDFVMGLLKCFPCVEKLHIVSYTPKILKNDVQCYAPLECLDQHLKKVQIMNYEEKPSDVNFIKFFVLNARVLESMKFVVHRKSCDPKWIACQHKKLQVNDRASRAAIFEFEAADCSRRTYSLVHMKHIHDLDMDPFDRSLCRCHDDVFKFL